jgi:hypothetical protein
MSFFEWLGRVVMLVLAGMITLSIIGAIAAIPYGSNLPRQIGLEHPIPPAPRPQPTPTRTDPSAAPDNVTAPTDPDQAGSVTIAPARPERDNSAEWLEVIAYALLALAGLGALALLLLWRMFQQHRRVAEALERRG